MVNRKDLQISWYGGEPLLALPVIESVTKHINECGFSNSEEGYNYSASIVTNGVLLSRDVVQKLKEMHVSFAQITLDGPPDVHDKRRYLHNKEGTFYTILSNIKNMCDLMTVQIRVNVDESSYRDDELLLDYLDENDLNGKVFVYLAPIHDIPNKNANCFTSEEFSDIQLKFVSNNLHRGYFSVRFNTGRSLPCGGPSVNSFVIDPLGDLYKCWDCIGQDQSKIGNVANGITWNDELVFWLGEDTFSGSGCDECAFLPICLGGCPFFVKNGAERQCTTMKYNYRENIKLLRRIKEYMQEPPFIGAVT